MVCKWVDLGNICIEVSVEIGGGGYMSYIFVWKEQGCFWYTFSVVLNNKINMEILIDYTLDILAQP